MACRAAVVSSGRKDGNQKVTWNREDKKPGITPRSGIWTVCKTISSEGGPVATQSTIRSPIFKVLQLRGSHTQYSETQI